MTQTHRIRLLVAATAVPVLALAVGPSSAGQLAAACGEVLNPLRKGGG
jgi:hypothetical protein